MKRVTGGGGRRSEIEARDTTFYENTDGESSGPLPLLDVKEVT